MSTRRISHDDMPGHDSFLDIVGNMVGILIILVLVVGVRAGRTAAQRDQGVSDDGPDRAAAERTETASLLGNLSRLRKQWFAMRREVADRAAERDEWETVLLAVQQELAQRRKELDGRAQHEFDLQRKLAAAQQHLDQLVDAQISLEATPRQTQAIESRPTPLGKAVEGRELHFRILEGRITPIPLEPLLDRLRRQAERQLSKLHNQSQWIDTVGPIGGFRMRYALRRVNTPPTHSAGRAVATTGSVVQLARWQLIPTSSPLGEPIDVAIRDGSGLRRLLDAHAHHRVTLTLWTYPDSFAELQNLKEYLHGNGYAVAIRPLPKQVPIGGSPLGSRSIAQ